MLRTSYPAMAKVARGIFEKGRGLEVEEQCLSIEQTLKLIPGTI
jgi:phosphoenolpyruvate phosphomutase